ncbi:COBRA-like protein 1 [Acorus gramineus]|uniref:COBRA-like protein 1 n=1 Tax=Acorus gramineus TaxID=55184 RepID=A0AAV9BMY7_ACOGR|nr:COBRA-like protein 1 [Acorus gramineus]
MDGADNKDPNGNITVRWDIMQWQGDGYIATVSINNYQLYRHIENPPGWRLSWRWPADEVIWSINGAEATEQGNCSRFKGAVPPHSCVKNPVVVDLLPGAPYNRQSANCCRGGVLSSLSQDPVRSIASFQISVGSTRFKGANVVMPRAYSVGLPGYSCGSAFNVTPTRFPEDGGRRWTQSLHEVLIVADVLRLPLRLLRQ